MADLISAFAFLRYNQPFKAQHPKNPSWEIASRLPEYLPPYRVRAGKQPPVDLPPVRILVHPEAIRVNYQTVRGLVPQLWETDGTKRRIDAAIHIGMAGPAPVYSIERRGHRDGYVLKDVDGELLKDQERRLREGEDWVWHGLPKELETELDLDDVLARWRGHSPVRLFCPLFSFLSSGGAPRNLPLLKLTASFLRRDSISGFPRMRADTCVTSSTTQASASFGKPMNTEGLCSCTCRLPARMKMWRRGWNLLCN